MTEELVHERPLLRAVLPPDKDLAVIRARREHVAKLWVGPRDPPDWSVVANELCSLMRLLPVDDFVDLDAPVAARGRQLLAKVVELHVVDQLRLCSRRHCSVPRTCERWGAPTWRFFVGKTGRIITLSCEHSGLLERSPMTK